METDAAPSSSARPARRSRSFSAGWPARGLPGAPGRPRESATTAWSGRMSSAGFETDHRRHRRSRDRTSCSRPMSRPKGSICPASSASSTTICRGPMSASRSGRAARSGWGRAMLTWKSSDFSPARAWRNTCGARHGSRPSRGFPSHSAWARSRRRRGARARSWRSDSGMPSPRKAWRRSRARTRRPSLDSVSTVQWEKSGRRCS